MQFDTDTLTKIVLGIIAVGAVYFGLVQPYLSGETKAEKRHRAVLATTVRGAVNQRNADAASRRKQIKETLDEFEKRQKKGRASLQNRLAQAGLSIGKPQFFMASAGAGFVVAVLALALSGQPLYGLAGAFVGGFGLPTWILSYLRKRRLAKFAAAFPDAIDAIVRGIKAGLPVGDSMRLIASEAKEPVRGEFRKIVEAQAAGMSAKEAVNRLPERVPTSEANFFAIVMSIQSDTGGNLSEALGGLSKVLRDRAKLRMKVQAVSSEAKSSAMIIGAMPLVVVGLISFTSPDYISILFTHPTGHVVIAASLGWMSIGVLMMRKMINFDI